MAKTPNSLNHNISVIENFLTDEETEHIKEKAVKNGLSSSALHIDTKIRADKDDIAGMHF